MDKVDVLLNPSAGGGAAGRLEPALKAHLSSLGLKAEIHRTEGPGDGLTLARELTEQGCRTLVVAGGDGSLFEAINGCMQADGQMPELALVPLGTGNDFAKSLGIPLDWPDACDRLVLGTRRRVDLGQCNDIFFINSLGVGLDAQIADIARKRRWMPGDTAYVAALAQSLLFPKLPRVTVSHDGGREELDVTLMVVANGSYEGGRFQLAPDADIEDGKLNLVVAPRLSRREIIRLFPKVTSGDVAAIPGYQHWLTRRASVLLPSPTRVHADGEIIYRQAKRLEVGIIPGAVCFLC
jgi:diacylglycerol kinase (ATP)